MNILVLHTQVPFTSGGAEVLVDGLVEALSTRGHQVEKVALPLTWNPVDRLLTSAIAWSLLDLSTFNGMRVDRVICTKYPTWAVQHPRKVLWLVHQHRQAYDLHGTAYSEFGPDKESRSVREHVRDIDRRGIGDCSPRFAISKNVSSRLKKYCGIDAEPLYPPVPRTGLRAELYEPFILSVSRIDDSKRVESIVRAWRHVSSDMRLVIAGSGPGLDGLRQMVDDLNLGKQIDVLGRVDDDRIVSLFNTCRGVYYAPVDEDYGYAAVEALTAAKPVITSNDSGGVLEFVEDGQTGLVSTHDPLALAANIDRLAEESFARKIGMNGTGRTVDLTWGNVVARLLGEPDAGT